MTVLVTTFAILILPVLTRSPSFLQSFQWFKTHWIRGAFIVVCAVAFWIMSGMLLQLPIEKIALQCPMQFLWLWVFASLATFFEKPRRA